LLLPLIIDEEEDEVVIEIVIKVAFNGFCRYLIIMKTNWQ